MECYKQAQILSYDEVRAKGQLTLLKLFLEVDGQFMNALRVNSRLRKAFIELTKPGGTSSPIDQTDQQFIETALCNRAVFACTQKVFFCQHSRHFKDLSQKQALLSIINNELQYVKHLLASFSSGPTKFRQTRIDIHLEMGREEKVDEAEDMDGSVGKVSDVEEDEEE